MGSVKNWGTGNFVLCEPFQIGFGSCGTKVYKVKGKLENSLFAVKCVPIESFVRANLRMLKRKTLEEFLLREVRYLCKMNSDNVIRYYSSWLEGPQKEHILSGRIPDEIIASVSTDVNNFLYIQTELCDTDLSSFLKEKDWKAQERRIRNKSTLMDIFEQILSGVEYIHSKGIIHRDLKPNNILLNVYRNDKEGEELRISAKICDFGFARECGSSPESCEFEQTADLTSGVGCFLYQSPEVNSRSVYSSKTDIYACGLILLEMIYAIKDDLERSRIFTGIRNGEQKVPTQLTGEFRREVLWIEQMTAQEPTRRPELSQVKSYLFQKTSTRVSQKINPVFHSDERALVDVAQIPSDAVQSPSHPQHYIRGLNSDNPVSRQIQQLIITPSVMDIISTVTSVFDRSTDTLEIVTENE